MEKTTRFGIVTNRFSRGSSYNGVVVTPGMVVQTGQRLDGVLFAQGYLLPVTKEMIQATFGEDGLPPVKCRRACGGMFLSEDGERDHWNRVHMPEIARLEADLAEAQARLADRQQAVALAQDEIPQAQGDIERLEARLGELKGEAVPV